MKRGAEKQISKDSFEEEEEQEETPQTGFARANESVLKTRPMRGLPKRASVASLPPPATQTGVADTPRFNGFSGFGSTDSLSSSTPAATNSSLAPTSTSTAKLLASFLASSSTAPSSSSEPLVNKPVAPTQAKVSNAQKDDDIDPAELTYYTSLRGLNESLRSAAGKAIDDDPFIDLVSALEQYKSLRADIRKKYDSKAVSTTSSSSTPAPVTTMPARPSGGFSFGGPRDSSSTDSKSNTPTPLATSTPGSGFTPIFPSGSSGFPFGGKPAESKIPEPKPSTSDTSSSKDSDAPVTSLPFPLFSKPSEEKSATPSFFGTKPLEDKKKPGSSDKEKPEEKPNLFTFGASSFGTSSFSTSAASGGFSFSASSAPTTSTTTAAVKTTSDAPSTSRFAGFGGFAKPPSTSTSTTPVFGFTSTLSGPSASFATTAAGSSTESASGTTGDAIQATTPTTEEAPTRHVAESFALNADNKHDQEGAGEEDEETVHSVKLKSYVLREEGDKKTWVEMGYGVLRLKKHKEKGARRVLLRSSSTGQILINFTFHSAFKPAQKAKNVTFLGYDAETKFKMYTLKTQTEQQARDLKEALDREIQAKEETE
ncbi:hypothetical protein Agabi119p4_1650 [Agaricus bisporus var. burnettii]|uniref:RanBD1 domain-containing protein n=1 Tax=Agaricus bisporus var. burnettii TaxID=192524 RepID=A0A8H7F7X5_AGABI|nr:hypothetical protein Agabi119p4_1650 [Agaricus bisporus var. burnettii]